MSYFTPILPASGTDATPSSEPGKPRSLAIQVARRMVLWACVNTLILTAVGYYFVSARAEQRALVELSGYLAVRLREEGQVFRTAEANLSKFSSRFTTLYSDPTVLPHPHFGAFFEVKADGTRRMRERFFTGSVGADGIRRDGTSGFVAPRKARLTAEFKRRLILDYRLVSELGPAWNGPFVNLYGGVPENGGVVYWPKMPWGQLVPANRPLHVVLAPTWSPLYFDAVAKRWNISYERPVVYDGKPILFIGEDILLDDLMSRLIWDHPVGAYNLILSKGGDLIAHPSRMNELKRSVPGLKVAILGDPTLASIYRTVSEDAKARRGIAGVRIIENRDIHAYVCYGELSGPDWWFVTVYPRALVLESAHEAANGLLILGFISFAIMTGIVLWVLRDRVGRPISQMRVASEKVSSGDYATVANGITSLPIQENNEIGLLARSFKTMAGKVGDATRHLEEIVALRTGELLQANQELKRLSFKDALTGAGNRRQFDLDLEATVAIGARHGSVVGLLLCDIDHFKLYNDAYGHPAGDSVLRLVAEQMARAAPTASLYRYGGEEFAMLLAAPDSPACIEAAASVVRSIEELGIDHNGSAHRHVTLSGGLAMIESSTCASGPAALLAAADKLLYDAKRNGRNALMWENLGHGA